MWPFPKKNPLSALPPSRDEKEVEKEFYELAEMVANPRVSNLADAELEKFIKSVDFYSYFERFQDTGSFYGSEFEIKATAGRIVGLYAREPWIFATASLIARTLCKVPFKIVDKRTNEDLDNHPLLKQLSAESNLESALTMKWNGYLNLILGGNFFQAFDDKYLTAFRAPVEHTTVNLSDDRAAVESITIARNENQAQKITIPYEQVVHWKFPNPYNVFYGMSLFTAASRPVILDRMQNEFNMAFYLRGATNAGVIETSEDISKTRMERMLRTFEQLYTGKRNWFRTIFLPKAAKWIKSGLTMQEMQHLEGLRENRLTLLAVLGIPPSKVGIVQDVNRSTSDNQDKDFWENTIEPLAMFVADGWNNSHLVKTIYSDEIIVVPDLSNVEALQGSLKHKGEQGKAVESYLTINEIRQDILGYEPLPGDRGDKFVSEIGKASGMDSLFSLSPATEETPGDVQQVEDVKQQMIDSLKAQATDSQQRLERKLGDVFLDGFKKYLDVLIHQVEKGLRSGSDVRTALLEGVQEREEIYFKEVSPILEKALVRGFNFANSQSKGFTEALRRIKLWEAANKQMKKVEIKRLRFNEVDQQAVDALRDEQLDGQRTTLVERVIDRFKGQVDHTASTKILDLVADSLEEGATFESIAASIRGQMDEAYTNQAFTIARNEVLTAVSQGLKWNHDVLGEVFDKTEKQWFHVGDVGSNPDARENHLGFENEGPQKPGYLWGGILEYPRAPDAPADEIINCRCTMVTTIPDDAVSSAETILETL